MKANVKLVRKYRRYSEEFKRSIVKDFEKGDYNVPQLSRLYHIQSGLIYRWIYKYSIFNEKKSQVVEMKSSNQNKINELERKVKELEQAVGQKQIMIDYLEKMMDLAKEELEIDIKKNFATPLSDGSEKTQIK